MGEQTGIWGVAGALGKGTGADARRTVSRLEAVVAVGARGRLTPAPAFCAGTRAGMMGRSPNRDGGTSDTDPLVMRMQLSGTATSEDDHVYPPMSSAGSHEGHGDLQRHA